MNYFFSLMVIFTLSTLAVKRIRKYSFTIAAFIFLALLTIYPKESLGAAKEGINLWVFVVMPSLFPFFIISDLLIALKVPENISRLFAPIARVLFNTSGYGAYVFIMSVFSGYPAGAKITRELVEDQKITPGEGQKILSFGSTSGPLFIIGAVGAGMLKNTNAGYIIFICHVLGAIINGVLVNLFERKKNYKHNGLKNFYRMNEESPRGSMLSSAIGNSLYTSGFIGGYIILFSVIIALLDRISFFSTLIFIMDTILPGNISNFAGYLLKTSLEISNGCKILSDLSWSFEYKLILSSFIIAFSGFSIIGQVSGIIGKINIDLKIYILHKLNHGLISSFLCFLMIRINIFHIAASAGAGFKPVNYNLEIVQLLLVLILILNIISIIKSRLKGRKTI